MTQMYKGIEIPTTGRDWELFTSMPCAEPARKLTAALKKAMRHYEKHRCFCKAWDIVDQVRDQYGETGAGDTEPRVVGQAALYEFAEATTRWEAEKLNIEGTWVSMKED